jgi:hypothetical protein
MAEQYSLRPDSGAARSPVSRLLPNFQFQISIFKIGGWPVATPEGISHNPRLMIARLFRVVWLLVWLELGLVLILVPWSEIWETNYFLYQYPSLLFFVNNPFIRGAISGLGIMNVFLALEAFRRRAATVASQG